MKTHSLCLAVSFCFAAAAALAAEEKPLPCGKQGMVVAGVVVDEDNKPVAEAYVYCKEEGQPSLSTRTDASGRFTFDQVGAGSLLISANSPRGSGYGRANAEGGDTNVTVQLGAVQGVERNGAAKLFGTVVNPDGKPAARVKVSLFPFGWQGEKQTDDQGRFSLALDRSRNLSSSPRVVIARDLARNLAAAFEMDDESTNVEIKLQRGLIVAGRINDTNGQPVIDAQVQPMFWTERVGALIGSPVRVDAEGHYELNALPPGRRYDVVASAKNFGQNRRRVEPAEGQTRIELERIELFVADQRIAGVVLDAEEQPVPRASLHTFGNNQPALNLMTDTQGRFAFEKVCAGPIRISANSQRGGLASYGTVMAQGGDTNIAIHLSPTASRIRQEPQAASLTGKPLPDLAPLGVTSAICPPDQPVLAVIVDAEQRPSRRALRLLGDQAAALKQKGIAVLVLQAGSMSPEAFAAWKKEAALPFPTGAFTDNPDQTRLAWGASALPWFVLADKTRQVVAEGFPQDELDAKLAVVAK